MDRTVPEIIAEIRKQCTGRVVWRVQGPDGAYCIERDRLECMDPERECREWLADMDRRFPDYIAEHQYTVASTRIFSLDEELALEAVAALERGASLAAPSPDLIRFDFINSDGREDSKVISHDEMRERYAQQRTNAGYAFGSPSTPAEWRFRLMLLVESYGDAEPGEDSTAAWTKIEQYLETLPAALRVAIWLTIETAPMDGTEFLGYRRGQVRDACRVPRDDCEMWMFGGSSADHASFPDNRPSHWQPKPPPPEDA